MKRRKFTFKLESGKVVSVFDYSASRAWDKAQEKFAEYVAEQLG